MPRSCWRIRAAVIAACLSLAAAGISASAAPVRLKTAEISATLSGNTVIGTWNTTEFRQYFDAGGSTVYVPRSGSPASG